MEREEGRVGTGGEAGRGIGEQGEDQETMEVRSECNVL